MKLIGKGDNRGITLVEVIVSMLVLAIIVVPLLSSFVLSSQVNLKARTKQYATTLAQNVMESFKNYDLEEVALQFNGVASPGAFKIVPTTSLTDQTYGHGYYETNSLWSFMDAGNESNHISMSIGKNASNKFYFRGNTAKTYYYTINDVTEGTKRFDLRITVSAAATPASGSAIKQNDYQIPDLTNLDINETAIINPNAVGISFSVDGNGDYIYNNTDDTYQIDSSSSSYDNDALAYFYNQHHMYVDQVYNDACLLGLSPSDPVYKTVDYLQKKISRKTTITIEDLLGENKILVTAKLEYKFNQGTESLIYTAGNPSTNDTKEYGGFYESVGFDRLENLYLCHTPLAIGKWVETKGDVIIIDNQSTQIVDDLKVFIAQQKVENSYVNIVPINVFAKSTGDINKINFYYDTATSTKELLSYDTSFNLAENTNYFKTLVTDGDKEDRFYDVKIQVMEHGSTEVLDELNSTVTR